MMIKPDKYRIMHEQQGSAVNASEISFPALLPIYTTDLGQLCQGILLSQKSENFLSSWEVSV